MFQIMDYNSKFDLQIDALDESYWGICETDKASVEIKNNDIVKLAVKDNCVLGLLHFKPIGDLIDCYHIIVDPRYQHQGIASQLMAEGLKAAKDRGMKTVVAHAVEHDGIVNAKKLLEKFDFQEMYSVKDYWNSLEPGEYCKQCGNYHCHCGVVVFVKKI